MSSSCSCFARLKADSSYALTSKQFGISVQHKNIIYLWWRIPNLQHVTTVNTHRDVLDDFVDHHYCHANNKSSYHQENYTMLSKAINCSKAAPWVGNKQCKQQRRPFPAYPNPIWNSQWEILFVPPRYAWTTLDRDDVLLFYMSSWRLCTNRCPTEVKHQASQSVCSVQYFSIYNRLYVDSSVPDLGTPGQMVQGHCHAQIMAISKQTVRSGCVCRFICCRVVAWISRTCGNTSPLWHP